MFRKSILSLIVTTTILLLSGCNKDEAYQKEIDIKQETIDSLNLLIAEKNQKIDELTVQLTEQLEGKEHSQTELEKAIQEYPWLLKLNPNTKWDKIIIYRYEGDPSTRTVVDPLFLEGINWLFDFRSVGAVSYPSGYQSDIDAYTYEFYEGEQKYAIKVIDRGVIEAGRDRLYFEVDEDIHLLGAAFMPKQSFISHDGLIAKMAASGAVRRGEGYVQLSGFRVQSRIAPLVEGIILSGKPENIGELIEKFTFYYYGLELVMSVYKDHVFLSGDGSEEWYSFKDADIAFTLEPG